MRNKGAAIRMAGPERTAEVIQRFAQAVVAEVRDVEDDAELLHNSQQVTAPRAVAAGVGALEDDPEPLHHSQQVAAARADPAGRIGALRVDARAVMRRT